MPRFGRLVRRVSGRSLDAGAEIEALLDARGPALLRESRVPGLVAAVRLPDGRVVQRAFGSAGSIGAMRTDTVFQVMSISKGATAFCALRLVDEGLLDLDEPVWRRLRELRIAPHRRHGFDPDGVTLRRLLCHRAGIDGSGYGRETSGVPPPASEMLTREQDEARALRMARAPGSAHGYTGASFALVQLLVEEATGTPFATVVRERVFRPLGMASSDFERTPELAARLATRHEEDGSPRPPGVAEAVSSSGLLASAEDLLALWAAMAPGGAGEPAGRGVVTPGACAEMLTPQGPDEDGTAWGLGLLLKRRRDDVRYLHGGYAAGTHGHVEGLLRRRAVLAVLTNGRRGAACVPRLSHELRRLVENLVPPVA